MRLAVGLPSLPATAIERAQIEAAAAALAESADLEFFAESTRLMEGDLPGPGYHYLRLPERHATRRFDAALHIVGRDFRPYEVGYLLARRCPSVLWLIDTMSHHVLVGGMAPHGRWDAYAKVQLARHPAGPRTAAAIAAGWGTRAVFRTTDPLPHLLADNRFIAAARDVADVLTGEPPIVQLPARIAALERQRRDFDNVRTVAVVAPNLSWPAPELRSLRALLKARPEVTVRYHLIKWFEAGVRGPAAELGVDDQIDWVIEDGVEWRGEVADSAEVVIATTGDPTLNDRGLVRRAMAAGQIAVVMRAPAWEALTQGGVVIVDPGREREPGLRETLLALVDDPELCHGISRVASAHAGEVTPQETAAALLGELRQHAASHEFEVRREAPRAHDLARTLMRDYCVPHNASASTRDLVTNAIDGVCVDPTGPRAWQVT